MDKLSIISFEDKINKKYQIVHNNVTDRIIS